MARTSFMYPNIAAEQARAQLTNKEFADALGVSRKTLYNWIKTGSIPQSKLEKMADLFDVSTDYLLGRTIVADQPGA